LASEEKRIIRLNEHIRTPKELRLVRSKDKITRVFIDDIEIPFACDVKVDNNIQVIPPDPMFNPGRTPLYIQGNIEITVIIRPRTIVVQREEEGDE
jgi:hypothetical protein